MFNLKKLVQGVERQINPFDGGATYSRPQPQQQQQAAPPRPASTARPVQAQQSISVQPVQRQSLIPAIKPIQAPKPLSVGVVAPKPLQVGTATIQPSATPQNLHIGNKTIAPNLQARTARVQAPQPNLIHQAAGLVNRAPQNFVNHVSVPIDRLANKSAIGRGLQTVGLGALQTGIEGAQGISGLVDIGNHKLGNYSGVSPMTQKLTNVAKGLDSTAKAEHSNKVLYHGTQVAGNVAGLLTGSTEAKALSEAGANAPKIGTVIKGATKLNAKLAGKVDTVTKGLQEGNIAQRGLAGGIKTAAKPGVQAGNAAFTAFQSGQQEANGRKISPVSIAENLALTGIGLPVAGNLAKETLAPVARGAVNGLREANLIAPSRLNPSEVANLSAFNNQSRSGAIMDEGTYQNGVAAAKKAGVNYQDSKQISDLLGAHQNYETQVAGRKELLKPTPVLSHQGGYAKIPSGAKDPAPDLHPDQKEFINQYAEMMKGLGEGNGVNIHPDGRRISNNVRSAEDKGKQLTQADWFDRARTELESGKAGYGASDEYKQLSNPELQSLLNQDKSYFAPDTARGESVLPSRPTPSPSTKLVPPQPAAALPATEQAGKVGGTSLVNDTSKLPVYGTKQVSGVDKAFRSTRSVIERQGENGKALGGLLQKSRDDAEIYQGQLQKALPTVRSLKGKEFENFVEATQGKVNPLNPKVAKAVEEWQAVHPGIRDRAVGAGLDVGDLGPNYYPHFIDYAKIFKDKNLYNQSINSLVETGQASTPEEAIGLLNHAKDVSRNRTFGNLEASREIDLPFYDKTPNSLVSYIGSSAKRISQTENLGAKDEHALKLIAQAGQQGFDTQAMKEAYNVASGAKRYGETATKVSNGLRSYESTTRLGLGALTNVGQNVNTGIVTGHLRTLTSAIKQLDPKTRSFVQDTGVISDAVLNDLKQQSGFIGKTLGHITAPGFGKVESINRSIAATAGRDYGLRLAQKGKIKELQRLGVTGDITGKTLTEAQQIQVARKVVEKTQFKVDAQDLPGWADSPGGKLVSQFRTFSYKQGGFISNEVLKPAAKGNFMPLGRLLTALPVGYGLYEAKRTINGRPEETSPTKRTLATFQNIGGAGLVFDIYQGLNPPNSKYTPADRRVSMALGTIGGPTAGLAGQVAGAASDLIQRKNTPTDPSKLIGKVPIGKNDQTYTDATQAARLALNQIPIVGGPIKNRVLPYKKQADAEAGYADSAKPTHGNPLEAIGQVLGKITGQKAAGADSLSPDQAIAKVKTDKKVAEAKYKATLSKNDYQLSKLDKNERQKLIDQGVTTADKLKGLDTYSKNQKTKLGLGAGKKTGSIEVNGSIDTHDKKVLDEYNTLDRKTIDSKVTKEPDYEYKVAQAKYDNKKANGEFSIAEDIKAREAVVKAKAGSKFDKNTRELYGLNKQELFNYVSNDKDGNAIVDKVIAYGDALAAAGAAPKNKFKNKHGAVVLNGDTKSGGGKGGRKGKGSKGIKLNFASGVKTGNSSALRSIITKNRITVKGKVKK